MWRRVSATIPLSRGPPPRWRGPSAKPLSPSEVRVRLPDRVAAFPFRQLVWLLPAPLFVHELEEWHIIAWYRQQFTNPPATPDFALHALLVGISVLGAAWTALGCCFRAPKATAYFVLPFFVPFVFANNLQHIYWQVAFGAYAPGVLASAFLNGPAILLLSWHACRNRLVPPVFVTALYLLSLPPLFDAVRAGRTVPAALLRVHEFGVWLAGAVFGAV